MATLEKFTTTARDSGVLKNAARKTDARHNLACAALTEHAFDRARLALIWEACDGRTQSYTFFELERLSNKVANVLSSLGVERGDRVFTLLGRTPALYATLPGALKLGAGISALFTDFGPEAIRQRLADSEARIVVTDIVNAAKVVKICDGLPQLAHVILVGASTAVARGLFDATSQIHAHGFEDLIADASAHFAPVAVDADETCFFIYTSGTTGLPKGVVHRHAIAERLEATAREVLALSETDFYWCTADPGWVTGLCYGIFAPWLVGCPVFAYEGDFDAAKWLDALERQQITCWYTTPTLLRLLMNHERGAAIQDSLRHRDFALRRIYAVGEPLNTEVIAWAEGAFGVPVYDNYWQTETGSQVIANRPGVPVRRGSMGKTVSGVYAAIIDEQGRELPANTVGDIAIRPTLRSLFKGYWHFPEATRACFRAGWYVTRDRGHRDADGYFWFEARHDDVITCEAQRVGPFEVESALATHAAIAEAAVVGVPDAVTTERVKAYIILRDGFNATRELAEEIALHVRAQLSPVARPREIEFCDELPKTRSGKIQRTRLRRRHAEKGGNEARSFLLE
ncbi:MAG: acetate--CoA ligase [Pyrinomonadaceae bacterium]